MKVSEGRIGRVFVIRLEDGDVVPECIEKFAEEKGISVGQVVLVGGIGSGEVVVGPRRSDEMPPDPVLLPVPGAKRSGTGPGTAHGEHPGGVSLGNPACHAGGGGKFPAFSGQSPGRGCGKVRGEFGNVLAGTGFS